MRSYSYFAQYSYSYFVLVKCFKAVSRCEMIYGPEAVFERREACHSPNGVRELEAVSLLASVIVCMCV